MYQPDETQNHKCIDLSDIPFIGNKRHEIDI